MKKLTLSMLAALLISAAGSATAFWGNNGWGGGWNPYDPWDPRYWAEEFFGGNGWGGGYGGPWGGYGGPWGGYGGPGYYGGPWGGGYPYYGGGYMPGYSGWGYAPYAALPAQTTSKPKAKAKANSNS